ncbi:MAG: tyrosine-type recombinase/integrase [Pseudomonadota bacterium]
MSDVVTPCWRHLDIERALYAVKMLKQRHQGVCRCAPLPRPYVEALRSFAPDCPHCDARFWPWYGVTVKRKVTEVMRGAGILGAKLRPPGIRNGFGVAVVAYGVPLTSVQRWLGHTRLETTATYLQVTGRAERRFAEQMW